MEEELAQVVQAIQTLYSPSTAPSVQSTLQLQLQQVQLAPAAWGLVGPLIDHEDPAVRFFAASTLQRKVSQQWDTLPTSHSSSEDTDDLPSNVQLLKESLLGWLSTSAASAYPAISPDPSNTRSGEKPVLRKLAAAATAISLKVEGRWKDWLLEVVMRVSAGGARREGVLEVLQVAVEEVGRAELAGSKKLAYMSSLSSTIPYLVSTLSSSLQSSTPSEVNSALTCFTSFLNAGQLSHPELTALYPLFLPHLSNPSTIVATCSAVEEVIERSSGLSGSGGGVTKFINRQRTNELVDGWANSPFVLGVVASAVQDANEGAEPDDEAMAVFKLFATLSEHFISILFDPPPASSSASIPTLTLTSPATHTLLSTLLSLTTFPGHTSESYTISELTSGSWMALQELGGDEGLVAGPGQGREGREGKEQEWAVYKGVFEALSAGLRRRGRRVEEGEWGSWPGDIRDAFRVHRTTVLSDLLQYSFYVLRDPLIGSFVSLASQQIQQAPSPSTTDSYEDLEATLFCLYALGEVVPLAPSIEEELGEKTSDLTTYLEHLFSPALLSALPSESGAHLTLRTTALKLVGAYAPWFSAHPTECLTAISFVVASLSAPSSSTSSTDLIPPAARALKGLCDANRKVLTGHVSSFVQVLGGLEGKIEDQELGKVLESVGAVVQALLPQEEGVEALVGLVGPVVGKLGEAVAGVSTDADAARLLALQQLLYLTALSRGLSDPDGDLVDLDASLDDSSAARLASIRLLEDSRMVEMRSALGNAVEGAAKVWAGDMEVVTALSDYIRTSTSDSLPSPLALPSLALLSLASSALQISPSSVWLGIASQLLARLARDRTDGQMAEEELRRVGEPVEKALGVVLSGFGDVPAMSENPDVVAAFLAFCTQIIKHYPRIFAALPPTYLDAVIAFGERGLEMQEQFSLKSTIELLLSSIQATAFPPLPLQTLFQSILTPHLPTLLRALLLAIAGRVPRSHLTQLSELLHACLLRLGEPARQVLKGLMLGGRGEAELGFPNERVDGQRKERFFRAVSAARTGKQMRLAVSDFALVCRGLEGSAYAASTAF
ncbi:hypothetical protein JCM11641_004016 [Rhodosporidiobolus odoratus]